jgi:hypothetical protein
MEQIRAQISGIPLSKAAVSYPEPVVLPLDRLAHLLAPDAPLTVSASLLPRQVVIVGKCNDASSALALAVAANSTEIRKIGGGWFWGLSQLSRGVRAETSGSEAQEQRFARLRDACAVLEHSKFNHLKSGTEALVWNPQLVPLSSLPPAVVEWVRREGDLPKDLSSGRIECFFYPMLGLNVYPRGGHSKAKGGGLGFTYEWLALRTVAIETGVLAARCADRGDAAGKEPTP